MASGNPPRGLASGSGATHAADVEQDLRARVLRQALPQPAQGAAPHRRAFAGAWIQAPTWENRPAGSGIVMAAAIIERRRRQAPDHAEQKKEMPPVIGVDHEAFEHLADEGGEGADQIRLPRRAHEDGAQGRPERGDQQREIGHAAGPAIDQEGLQIDVVLLQAVHAGEFERAHAVREIEQGAERQFLQAEAAAAADVVGLNELRALAGTWSRSSRTTAAMTTNAASAAMPIALMRENAQALARSVSAVRKVSAIMTTHDTAK